MQSDQITVTEIELKAAFERTELKQNGYTFQKAMDCEATKKCLMRLALNAQNKVAKAAPAAKVVTSKKKVTIDTQTPQRELWFKKYY